MIDIGRNFARVHPPIIVSFWHGTWGLQHGKPARMADIPAKEIVLVHRARHVQGAWWFDVWYNGVYITNVRLLDNEYMKVF
jgi:hypothetical protein